MVVGKYPLENVGEKKHLTYKSYKSVFMQKRPRQKKEQEKRRATYKKQAIFTILH